MLSNFEYGARTMSTKASRNVARRQTAYVFQAPGPVRPFGKPPIPTSRFRHCRPVRGAAGVSPLSAATTAVLCGPYQREKAAHEKSSNRRMGRLLIGNPSRKQTSLGICASGCLRSAWRHGGGNRQSVIFLVRVRAPSAGAIPGRFASRDGRPELNAGQTRRPWHRGPRRP